MSDCLACDCGWKTTFDPYLPGERRRARVRAQCHEFEHALTQPDRSAEGVYTMTESEFKEEIRRAQYSAYEKGWHDGAGWPQSEANPYAAKESA